MYMWRILTWCPWSFCLQIHTGGENPGADVGRPAVKFRGEFSTGAGNEYISTGEFSPGAHGVSAFKFIQAARILWDAWGNSKWAPGNSKWAPGSENPGADVGRLDLKFRRRRSPLLSERLAHSMTASNAIARSCRRRRLTRIERARLMVLVTRPAAAQTRPRFVHRAYPEFACAASIRMAPHAHNFSVSRDPAGMPNRAHTGGVECVLQNGQHRRGERVEARGPGGELQVARAACTVVRWQGLWRTPSRETVKFANFKLSSDCQLAAPGEPRRQSGGSYTSLGYLGNLGLVLWVFFGVERHQQSDTQPTSEAMSAFGRAFLPFHVLDMVLSRIEGQNSHASEILKRSSAVPLSSRHKAFYDKLDSWPNILRHAKQQLEKDQNLRRKQQNPASVLIQQLIEFAMFVRDSTSGPRCNLEYACWPLAWMLAVGTSIATFIYETHLHQGNVEMPTSDDIIQVLIEYLLVCSLSDLSLKSCTRRAALRGEELPKEQLPSISVARVMQPLNAMFFTSPVALLANHHLAGAQPIPHILQATRWRAFGSADAPTLFKVENIIINGLFSMVFGGALAQDTLQNILSDPVIDEALSLEEASNEWTRFVLPPSPPLDGLTFSPASSPGPGGPVGSVEFMPIAYKEPSTTEGTNAPEHASSTSTSTSIIFTLPSTNVTITEAVSTTKRKHAQLESAPLIEESSSEQFEPRKKNKNAMTGAGVLALANPKRPKRPRPQVYDNKTSDSETENSSASELSSETETPGRIDEENKYIEIEMPLYSAKNVTSPPIHKYVYTSWSESAADGTRDPDIVQCKVPYEYKIFERVNGTFEKAVQAGFAYGQSLAPGALSSAISTVHPKNWGKIREDPGYGAIFRNQHILVERLMDPEDSLPLELEYLNTSGLAAAHCNKLKGYTPYNSPPDLRQWFTVASPNTRSMIKFSHRATVLILDEGEILLCVGKTKTAAGHIAWSDLEFEASLVEQLEWDLLSIPARSVLCDLFLHGGRQSTNRSSSFLRPHTPYFYYNIQSTLLRGVEIFQVSTMLDSICGIYRKAFSAPMELIPTLPLLSRLFSFWFTNQDLAEGAFSQGHFHNHLPDLQFWPDLLSMISVGNVLFLAKALDWRTYPDLCDLGTSPEELQEWRISVDHAIEFRAWASGRYKVMDGSLTLVQIFDARPSALTSTPFRDP
ncbi:hypothetical protein B0H15DRAFT_807721 [Mycena belliarum]|uniref:Uncharacterized protein n=1 Tax=Mycena belliarum TaxID=1033014 RepID=A0AAD6TQ07_9AGAR|nr:hypothetical protein B0H15DRAFT_807721 [Mycena belliae]